ncbi:hypothetical protein [Enterococcus spodopteracolus]|uniref:hypothetical protein n=2 Tax=Enterococcus spodopteracolus TaxID=3034501 RepID=UPI0026482493|nr:hypothetical protein [Enterococcus spodopteracolus]
MTNGSSQGLFVVVAIVIFGIFVLISYLLFKDTLKPSLSGVFSDSLGQSTDYLTGVANQEYLNFSTTNGIGINGLTSSAYNEDGSIKSNLKTLVLPNTIRGKDLKTIDFNNSGTRFQGVEKIVGNSNLNRVTSTANMRSDTILELDFSKTKVTNLGVQYFLRDNTSIKKLTLGEHFTSFGYAPFQNSVLEELTLTNKTSITDLSDGFMAIPRNQITLNAPKELEEQLKSYESRFKKVNYY